MKPIKMTPPRDILWRTLTACLLSALLCSAAVTGQTSGTAVSPGPGPGPGVLPDIRWSQTGFGGPPDASGGSSGPLPPGGSSPADSLFPDVPGPGNAQVSCSTRSRCQVEGHAALTYRDLNCFCDPLCQVYDDCCKDHVKVDRPVGDSGVRLQSKMVECERLLEYDREVEVYVVNTCPKRYGDPEVIRQCEYAPDHHADFFYKLPVSGVESGILYKNYFCALCTGEENLSFWNVDIDCDHPPDGNVTADPTGYMNKIIQESSDDWYRCHKKLNPPNGRVRRCKSAISRCLKNSNRKIKKKCKKETSYMYAGKEVFKNKWCAQCNDVNDTYLSCEDSRTPTRIPGGYNDFSQHFSAFSLLLDFNKGRASIKDLREGVSGERHVTIQFSDVRECPANHMYDPFAKQCRLLNCPPDSRLQNGQCVIESANPTTPRSFGGPPVFEQGVDTPGGHINIEFVPPPTINTKGGRDPFTPPNRNHHDDTDDDTDESTHSRGCRRSRFNHTEYEMFKNGTVLVHSLNKMFGTREYEFEAPFLYIFCAPPKTKVDPKVLEPNATHTMFMFKFDRMQDLVSFVSVLVSLVAIMIMFIVYLMLPPMRNIAGKNIMCLAFSLFLAQSLFLVTVHLPRTDMFEVCLGLAAAMHYFWLAAFFWMNVLAFDIWRTFVYRANNKSSEQGRVCRFVAYSIYAWFMPAGIVAAALVLDFEVFDGVDYIYLPHYGKGSCWIVQKYALLFLFALPLAILLLTNIVFYLATVINLCRISQMAEVANRGKDRCRLVVYIKLSLVMGLTWTFAFLGLLMEMDVFWYLFIGFNAFQGVFICFAFVLNKKVFKLLSSKGRVSNRRQQNSDFRACSNGVRSGPGGSNTANRSYFSDSSAKVIAQETSI